jgi:hypothetical protein
MGSFGKKIKNVLAGHYTIIKQCSVIFTWGDLWTCFGCG